MKYHITYFAFIQSPNTKPFRDYANIDQSACQTFKYDVRGKHNPIAVVLLQQLETNVTFIVANTHLFWDPARADIKTVQTAAVVRAIDAFSHKSLEVSHVRSRVSIRVKVCVYISSSSCLVDFHFSYSRRWRNQLRSRSTPSSSYRPVWRLQFFA
jgi:mRNA deadenylase 3'-5' endonuclease subunit Ccr4